MTDLATSDDYEEYTGGDAPANIAALLRSASNMVRRDTRVAIYDVDTDGAATDDDLIAALRDATCAQAAAWAALGINPLSGGVVTTSTGVVSSKSLDGASISYAGAASAAEAQAAATTSLVPDAVQILRDAGLLDGRVWTYG